MMLTRLELFVRRLMEDDTFRALTLRDPQHAVATFGLTGPERSGALKLCVQMAGGSSVRETEGWWH